MPTMERKELCPWRTVCTTAWYDMITIHNAMSHIWVKEDKGGIFPTQTKQMRGCVAFNFSIFYFRLHATQSPLSVQHFKWLQSPSEVFLLRVRGLRTEGVVCCTDCKAPWGKLGFVILGCINKMTWLHCLSSFICQIWIPHYNLPLSCSSDSRPIPLRWEGPPTWRHQQWHHQRETPP